MARVGVASVDTISTCPYAAPERKKKTQTFTWPLKLDSLLLPYRSRRQRLFIMIQLCPTADTYFLIVLSYHHRAGEPGAPGFAVKAGISIQFRIASPDPLPHNQSVLLPLTALNL